MSIENWNEDSILSRAGYKADGSQSTKVRKICIDCAIDGREENALEVLRHLRWLSDDRGVRFPRAQRRWQEDTEYISSRINAGLPGDPALVRYQTIQLRFQQEHRENNPKDIFARRRLIRAEHEKVS